MPLGTKNRILNNAILCRDHLRNAHRDMISLVNEYIGDIEGDGADASKWNQFTDLKRSEREMLERVEQAFQKWLNP